MSKPVVILDPGHGGSTACYYDLESGIQMPFTPREVAELSSAKKRYLSQDAYLRWRRGELPTEPRFYFEHQGRRITYGDPGDLCSATPSVREKDLTLDLVRTMRRLLVRHCLVKSTRDRDGYVSPGARARCANRVLEKYGRETVLVSLHADASDDPEESGFRVYRLPDRDHRLAELFRHALARHLEEIGAGPGHREVLEERSHLLLRTDMPGVVLQLGFLSNPDDARRLADRHLRRELAKTLCQSLVGYFQSGPAPARADKAGADAEGGGDGRYSEVQA